MSLKHSSQKQKTIASGKQSARLCQCSEASQPDPFYTSTKMKADLFLPQKKRKGNSIALQNTWIRKNNSFLTSKAKVQSKESCTNKTCSASCQPTLPLLGKLDLPCLESSFSSSIYTYSVHLYCSTSKWSGSKVVLLF